ncbi:AAA family ATPase [Amycolatopsis acidicola]|uniref:AAA family ATPase n=1 Tax=Amycolatopsis acidicola TaxID=2596893 RepID=A0A5N0UQP7_9PSEU|nr:AAA family ATPase [Amycolatopsis acidicola]KAA9153336.1 AAA family ATPase [Amycolatopsis acidicola]
MTDAVLDSLRAAVESAPFDVPLRLHLAGLLVERGLRAEAIRHVASALALEPDNADAAELMARAPEPERKPANVIPLRFVEDERAAVPDDYAGGDLALEIERSEVSLADVGGMTEVKKRLNAAFLAPMRNPELRAMYGKSMRGGLLLYGPPGCGKTFLAKAVAGELGARFLSVGLNDVLDMWLGNSERNLHEVFVRARAHAPCVLFVDELDGIGQKRSRLTTSAGRNVVNQLLAELDGVASSNEGLFVLAATNAPWDVDLALRRPGRFDRTVLVLPPDEPARQAILELNLRDRPVEGVNLKALARQTDGFSGADLAHVCETAAEQALLESVDSGQPRPIGMAELSTAVRQVRPSTAGWFATAKNVALYGNTDGTYDDLLAYLKKRRLL